MPSILTFTILTTPYDFKIKIIDKIGKIMYLVRKYDNALANKKYRKKFDLTSLICHFIKEI